MAKTKAQKKELVTKYRELLGNTKSVFIVKPSGVSANESVELKKKLFEVGSTYNVVKNAIFKIALKEEGLPAIENLDQDEHAIVFVEDQVTEAAKIINEFAKETEKIEIQAGIFDKNAISGAQVKELAELPSKDALIAQLLSVFNAPIEGVVNVINGNTRNLVQVMQAIADQKQATN